MSEDRPSTEGTTVYLPEFVEEFGDKVQNFAVYKVYSTHQAAHLEFGSFFFRFGGAAASFTSRTTPHEEHAATGARRPRRHLTDMERFFDLFDDRQLASDLFTVAEDTRVDFLVKREYGGIRRSWRLTQERELERRPRLPRPAAAPGVRRKPDPRQSRRRSTHRLAARSCADHRCVADAAPASS